MPHLAVLLVVTALTLLTGCGSPDERLVAYSERSIQQQYNQNEQIARQSQAVTQETGRLAQAARDLVAADARARQELIVAQREVQTEIQRERTSLDRQHAELETERRDLASARHREPIVAAAVESLGWLLACLLPLGICAYALRQAAAPATEEELSAVLIQQLVNENSFRLEPAPHGPRLAKEQAGPLLEERDAIDPNSSFPETPEEQ